MQPHRLVGQGLHPGPPAGAVPSDHGPPEPDCRTGLSGGPQPYHPPSARGWASCGAAAPPPVPPPRTAAWPGAPCAPTRPGPPLPGSGPTLARLEKYACPGDCLGRTPASPDHLSEPSLFLDTQLDSVDFLHHGCPSHNTTSVQKIASTVRLWNT